MSPLLAWVEQSAFSVWVRDSGSLWAYPTVLFLHTIGLSLLVGPNFAIDLRLLGVGRQMPLAPLEKFYRVMWTGFWINAASGVVLLMTDTKKLSSADFYVKMGFIALGVITMIVRRRKMFRDPAGLSMPAGDLGRRLAIASMVCWAGAITAGRLMAYLEPIVPPPDLKDLPPPPPQ